MEPWDGAVLVVDEAVGMVGVGLGDQAAGGSQILFAPGAQLQFAGKVAGRAWLAIRFKFCTMKRRR